MSTDYAEFVIDYPRWGELDGLEARCAQAIEAAVKRMDDPPLPGQAVILFTCDNTVAGLNGQYRKKDQPTNVLAFPAPEREGYPGDIALAYETCRSEAELAGISLMDRAIHLALHGFLHLNGYTHDEDGKARLMEELEAAALGDIGIRDPYLTLEKE